MDSTGVATTASGSGFLVVGFWSGASAFTNFTDSKSNSYTNIGGALTVGGADNCRAAYVQNGTGGAAHTFRLNLGSSSANLGLMIAEIVGGVLTGLLDVGLGRDDVASPFTLAAGQTLAQNAELLITALVGNSGSNPATMAETGLGGSSILVPTRETNGSINFASAMASQVVSGGGTFNPSWTQTGGTGAATWLFSFKELPVGASIAWVTA